MTDLATARQLDKRHNVDYDREICWWKTVGTVMHPRRYSVTEATEYIKRILDSDTTLRDLWLVGEISNWSRSRAGHCYFTLKDAGAAIRAVIWRSSVARLTFAPKDGQAVLAHGHVSVYEPQGQYQLYVDEMQPMGRGALYEQFEALKARLSAEGLFDKERKRALPLFPSCIGVVTSPTGAALRDILNVLGRRWPLTDVLLSPTLVQGDRAPPQIVAALDALYGRDDIELIIIARGGGSIEDLWAFNDERVARAIVAAPVPVISGVGHETDFTIADFCADVRAPTPSAAAEIAVPDQIEERGQLAAMCSALAELVLQQTRDARQHLLVVEQLLAQCSPRFRVLRDRQGTDGLQQRLDRGCQHQVALLRERLLGMTHRLRGLDPYATLERGYAIVYREDGKLVRRVAQVHGGDAVTVRVVDGDFSARVEER